jgi:large subunit ribosomal protein L30
MRLKQKHAAVIMDMDRPESKGLIFKTIHSIAYGEIDDETAKLLIEKRGRMAGDKPVDSKKVAEFMNDVIHGKKSMDEVGIKPFFRLNPPRGGFKRSIKLMVPRGILGNHGKKINDLVKRML